MDYQRQLGLKILDAYRKSIFGKVSKLLEQTIAMYGKPEIINSDQGSQYTCANWVKTLQELDIRISMDGKGRATDHGIIERWFRTLKQK